MKHEFFGFFGEGLTAVSIPVSITSNLGTPVDPFSQPTYRIYEAGVLVPGGTGSLSKCDTGTITGATNPGEITITTPTAHGLETGNRVTIASVAGNTAANGDWTITVVDAFKFTLVGSAANGPYTAGSGNWHVTGIYKMVLDLSAGYSAGKTYTVVINWTDSAPRCMTGSFIVT